MRAAVQEKHILLIDDDRELTSLLCEYLGPQGYKITVAHDGKSGLQKACGEEHFDLILLDVMLPLLDGFEVLKRLRLSKHTPVLMLTAKGDDFDRIFGLELGADDYLPKPFNHRELSARIKAIVRRIDYMADTEGEPKKLQVDDVSLCQATQQVSCAGNPVVLTGTEFSILRLLMAKCGNIVTKRDISEQVLGRKLASFDRSIDMHVSNLRKKLAAYSSQEKIKTIRGSGYMLVLSS